MANNKEDYSSNEEINGRLPGVGGQKSASPIPTALPVGSAVPANDSEVAEKDKVFTDAPLLLLKDHLLPIEEGISDKSIEKNLNITDLLGKL